MFVSLEQIKAARALLRWNQKELAQHAGLNDDQVHGFEAGRTRSLDVLEAIVAAIQSHGVEFTDGDGVRRKQIDVRTYRGRDGFRAFMDDVYHVAQIPNGNICMFNGVPAQLIKWLGDDWYAMHAKRMSDIKDRFSFRVLVEEGEQNLIGKGFAEYRGFPKHLFKEKTIYVYGDRVGFLSFADDVQIVVLTQSELSESLRVLFDIVWNTAARA